MNRFGSEESRLDSRVFGEQLLRAAPNWRLSEEALCWRAERSVANKGRAFELRSLRSV